MHQWFHPNSHLGNFQSRVSPQTGMHGKPLCHGHHQPMLAIGHRHNLITSIGMAVDGLALQYFCPIYTLNFFPKSILSVSKKMVGISLTCGQDYMLMSSWCCIETLNFHIEIKVKKVLKSAHGSIKGFNIILWELKTLIPPFSKDPKVRIKVEGGKYPTKIQFFERGKRNSKLKTKMGPSPMKF